MLKIFKAVTDFDIQAPKGPKVLPLKAPEMFSQVS